MTIKDKIIKASLVLIFLIFTSVLFAQSVKIDSLEKKRMTTMGKEKILVLNELAIAYWYVDFPKSIEICNEALKLSDKYKFYNARARTLNILGVSYYNTNKLSLAAEFYEQSLFYGKKYGSENDVYKCLCNFNILYTCGFLTDSLRGFNNYKEVIDLALTRNELSDFCVNLTGLIYYMGPKKTSYILEYLAFLNQKKAVDVNFKHAIIASKALAYLRNNNLSVALGIYDSIRHVVKDPIIKVTVLHNIGIIYFQTQKFRESILFLADALELSKQYETTISQAPSIESDLGTAYLQIKDYKESLDHLITAKQMIGVFPLDKAILYNNLGLAYLAIDSIALSKQYLQESLSMFESLNNTEMIVGTLNSLSHLYLMQRNYLEANRAIERISQSINKVQSLYIAVDSYKLLSEYYENKKEYQKSYQYLKQWKVLNDSLISNDNNSKLIELQTKYQTEKKELLIKAQEMSIKSKKRYLSLSISAGFLLLIALSAILVMFKKRNQAYKFIVKQNLALLNTQNSLIVGVKNEVFHRNHSNESSQKYAGSALTVQLKEEILAKLETLIKVEKIFNHTDLSLEKLADKCETNRTYLSSLINERYGIHFNSFINKLRVEEAMRLMTDKNLDIPLKVLYSKVGFNSNTTFYQVFKKLSGTTPHFYFKTVRNID